MDYRLKNIFDNTFIDFSGNLEVTDEKLTEFYDVVREFEYNTVSHLSPLIREYHYFYHFCLILNELNKNDPTNISRYYLSSILFILNNKATILLRSIQSQYSAAKKSIRKQTEQMHDYVALLETKTIQSETLAIFLQSFFLDVDPMFIINVADFYKSAFSHILLSYVKKDEYSAKEDLAHDIAELLSMQERNLTKCNRLVIYDTAIKRVEMEYFMERDNNITGLATNLSMLQDTLISNDMQNLFNALTSGSEISNPKLSILSIFYNQHELLDTIEDLYPAVFKVLKCVCVAKTSSVDTNQFNVIRKYIEEPIYLCLVKNKYDIEKSDNIANQIAFQMATSFCTKDYYDINTLHKVSLNNNFLYDLRSLIEYLLIGKLNRGGKPIQQSN